MQFDLTLTPTRFNDDEPIANDYGVVWTSDEYGRQVVGRIRLATERAHRGDVWWWGVTVHLPFHGGRGTADTLEDAKKDFRRAIERLAEQYSHEDWTRAFQRSRGRAS